MREGRYEGKERGKKEGTEGERKKKLRGGKYEG